MPVVSFIPNSSWVASFEYDEANLRLTTQLKSGAIYQHAFVLPPEWDALKTAKSHGKHFARAIMGKHLSVTIKKAKSPISQIKHRR